MSRAHPWLVVFLVLCCTPGLASAKRAKTVDAESAAEPAAETTAAEATLDSRVEQIRGHVCGDGEGLESLFHPGFLAQVPLEQLTPIFEGFCAQGGPVVEVVEIELQGPHMGRFEFVTEKGRRFPVTVGETSS